MIAGEVKRFAFALDCGDPLAGVIVDIHTGKVIARSNSPRLRYLVYQHSYASIQRAEDIQFMNAVCKVAGSSDLDTKPADVNELISNLSNSFEFKEFYDTAEEALEAHIETFM